MPPKEIFLQIGLMVFGGAALALILCITLGGTLAREEQSVAEEQQEWAKSKPERGVEHATARASVPEESGDVLTFEEFSLDLHRFSAQGVTFTTAETRALYVVWQQVEQTV